jgi:hypothetical protein
LSLPPPPAPSAEASRRGTQRGLRLSEIVPAPPQPNLTAPKQPLVLTPAPRPAAPLTIATPSRSSSVESIENEATPPAAAPQLSPPGAAPAPAVVAPAAPAAPGEGFLAAGEEIDRQAAKLRELNLQAAEKAAAKATAARQASEVAMQQKGYKGGRRRKTARGRRRRRTYREPKGLFAF